MIGTATQATQYNATGGRGGGGKGDKGPKRGPGKCNQWMQSGACSRSDEPGGVCIHISQRIEELAKETAKEKAKEKTAVAAKEQIRKGKAKTAVAAKEEKNEIKREKAKREDGLQRRQTALSRAHRRRMPDRKQQLPPALASVLIGIKIPARTAINACFITRQHAETGKRVLARKVRDALTGTCKRIKRTLRRKTYQRRNRRSSPAKRSLKRQNQKFAKPQHWWPRWKKRSQRRRSEVLHRKGTKQPMFVRVMPHLHVIMTRLH